MIYIEKYIKNKGGVLSGDLARYIQKKGGITNEAARKRVQRLNSPMHKITGLFSDKKVFVYHSDNFQNPEYFTDLVKALKTEGKHCYSIINAINYHHGLIPMDEIANYSISPVNSITGHMKFSSVIGLLEKHNLIHETSGRRKLKNQ